MYELYDAHEEKHLNMRQFAFVSVILVIQVISTLI